MTRLLLVDDDDAVRVTLAANLELEGFEIVEADSGESALACIANSAADVVLSDVRMGGMNGVEMLVAMRRDYPDLPIILTTAFSSEDLLREAYLSGAFTVLPKPFTLDRAVTALQRAVRRPGVLIVDDVTSAPEVLAAALQRGGLMTRVAHDGQRALQEVRSGNYDVVVIDLQMPDVDGVTLAAQLRASAPSISIIAFSEYAAPEVVKRVSNVAIHAYMRKPIDPVELIEAIAHARSKAPQHQRAPQ